MTLGVCGWAFADVLRGSRPPFVLAELAMHAGFDFLEAVYTPRSAPPAEPRPPSASWGVRSVATLQLHRYPLLDPVAERRTRAVEVVEQMLGHAAAWGARTISLSPGPAPAGQAPGEALLALPALLTEPLKQSRRLGVQLGLENVPGHCLSTREAMATALELLGEEVGVCLDLGNALLDPPIEAWIEQFGERLIKLHISDGTCTGGTFQPTSPGSGTVPWAQVGAALARLPVRPDTFVEAPLPPGASEQSFLRELRAAVARCLSL